MTTTSDTREGLLQQARDAFWTALPFSAAKRGPWTVDEIERAIEAALSTANPTVDGGVAWQPIDTAPKDGTPILVARAGEDVGCDPVEITHWYAIEQTTWEHVEGDLWRKVKLPPIEGWNNNGHRATHWMPPPKPPALSSPAPVDSRRMEP